MNSCIDNVCRANEHPLAQVFVKYQRTVYIKVYPLVMKHIQKLIRIKVPYESLPEQKGTGASSQETPTGTELSGNDNTCAVSLEGENDKSTEISSHNKDKPSNLEEVTEEIKSDIKVAIDKGESEMAKLSKENTSIIKRMESFDMDAMDDLFEDSDGDEETEVHNKTTRSTSSSLSSLPYSSLTSRESASSVEIQNDDICIEELETEALKRHLQVSLMAMGY